MADHPDGAGSPRPVRPRGAAPRPVFFGVLILAGTLAWLEVSAGDGGGMPRLALLGLGATAVLVLIGWSFDLARGKGAEEAR